MVADGMVEWEGGCSTSYYNKRSAVVVLLLTEWSQEGNRIQKQALTVLNARKVFEFCLLEENGISGISF